VKTNSMQSLGVNVANPSAKTAVFTSKANLKDVTDPLNPISLGGNLTLYVTMTDRGEPGTNDEIGITLWDGSTLLYSSNWSGTNTLEMVLSGGNLVVQSGFSLNPAYASEEVDTNSPLETADNLELTVFPNPYSEKVTFRFSPNLDGRARIELYNIEGQLIDILFENSVTGGQDYEVNYFRKSANSEIILYRLTIGDQVKTGRLIQGNF